MSKSHLIQIKDLLKKKPLEQDQVKDIESHFRDMSNSESIVDKRQEAFDEFKQKVENEGTCVITLTPEELLTKGIVYKKSLTKQATEAVQAVSAWVQATANWYTDLSYMMSEELFDDYAGPTEPGQEQGSSEESVTPAIEDEGLPLSTEVRLRSSSVLSLQSSAEPDSNNIDNLTSTIKKAHGQLRAYLMDDDKAAFDRLYMDMMHVIDHLSPKPGNVGIGKNKLMERITALKNELEPQKFNFEGQGGLKEDQVTLWFTVKFWLCSTFKAILNAVGLRSAANFFTPAQSDEERVIIGINLQNLTDAVDQFENTLKNTYPDPDSESESGYDSDIRIL
ncbi:MAG: hypothetical protein P1U39_05945 [Legionellaceae bacterium]|nr:hypothetical protein [Legionellaceae bacterium]